jgi:hypothetical protein
MPLFLIYFCFIHWCRYEYIEPALNCLGFALWMFLNMTGSVLAVEMSCCDCCGLKSVEELTIPPTGLEPMPHTSVALTAQYLNVRQRKIGTIIVQTVHISSSMKGSLPMEDFFKHNPNYFQITLPGSSTVTPPYQWRRLRKRKPA